MSDLDRYVIEAEVGHGGMSVVHRARDTKLPRTVALKVLHEFLARQAESRHRFHREAVAVARLEHRAILAIYDYSGPEADKSFIVTEFIDGPTLRALIDARGVLPWPEMGALITAELAAALHHAHEAGVLHRDIKPENVMVQPNGQLKLMDFGIAEIVGGATRLTATGALVGSPAHMAPEVIDGKPADHRADIFSLGTILFWLCTGRLPFEGPHPSALFRQILEGRHEDPRALNPKIGRRLSRIMERCLVPDPDARFETAEDLREALLAELDAVGLTPAEAKARALLLDPEAFEEQHRETFSRRLFEAATTAAAANRAAAAADAVNRLLAHVPDHPGGRALLARLARGRSRRRQIVLASLALVLTAGIGVAATLNRTAPDATGAPQRPLARADSDGRLGDLADLGPAGGAGGAAGLPGPGRTADSPAPSPSPAARPAPPQPSRRAAAEPPAAAEDAAPVEVTLRVQIGRAYADVYVNGALRADLTFAADVRLEPGEHMIEVVRDRAKILARLGLDAPPDDRPFPPFGRFRPRLVQVDPSGQLYEKTSRGLRPLVDGVLLFRLPLTQAEADRIDGWTSS